MFQPICETAKSNEVFAGNFDLQVTEDEAEYEDRVVMTDGEGRTRHE